MTKRPVTIQNNMDMEDRPIAHLVQEASQIGRASCRERV